MTPMLKKTAEAFQADLREQGKLYEIGGGPDPQRLMLYTGECADLPRALRAALLAVRGMDGHGVEMNWWSERVVDAILADKPKGGA